MKTQNWDTAMLNHKFTTQQEEILDFFQVQYKCNDARDDYAAQRKAGDASKEMPLPFDMMQPSQHADDDDQYNFDDSKEILPTEEELANRENTEISQLNQYGCRINADMQTAVAILQTSGALEPGLNGESGIPLFTDRAVTGGELPPSEWKQKLADKKESILSDQARQISAHKDQSTKGKSTIPAELVDGVKVIDQSFLQKTFKAKKEADQLGITNITKEFTLNEEQERAFRIIANHAIENSGEQLKMYLGGMAGTGKSQVIKALIHLFKSREEGYRFLCLAPTGAAAALIGGSTYHSILKFNQGNADDDGNFDTNDNKDKGLTDVHNRLQHVDYIFLDEVSMIDCEALFQISSRLSKALQPGVEFGGINFICAGDFAQLPPVMSAYPLHTGRVYSTLHYTNARHSQNAAIGKALWHQFITVVILQKNMRQRSQNEDDARFRQALVNMRYQYCSQKDVDFLSQ